MAGGIGTTFVSAKIGILQSEDRGLKLAVGPTLEILNQAAMLSGPAGQARTQWGLPVSIQLDREAGRIYASSGYFSPGIGVCGGRIRRSLGDRMGRVNVAQPRVDEPGGNGDAGDRGAEPYRPVGRVSFDVTPNIAVFGSIGQTIATAAENGAGTTISFGLSLSAGPVVFTK